MVWTLEYLHVNVFEGSSAKLVKSWERLLMLVTDVSTVSTSVIFSVKWLSGSSLYLVRYVMGELLLWKVGVFWLVTCYVVYAQVLAISLLSMFFVCFLEVVNKSFTVTKQTTLLNITDKPNTTSTGTRQSALLTAPTTHNALHSKVGIRTYNKTH